MKTTDGMKMLLNFAFSEERRTWCLSVFGRVRNDPFVLPVFGLALFGLRRSPATVVFLGVIALLFGALSVPSEAKPTSDLSGGGEDSSSIEVGPLDKGRTGFKRFLLRGKFKIYSVHGGVPPSGPNWGDWGWSFPGSQTKRTHGIFAHVHGRLYFGGDQGYSCRISGDGDDTSCSLNTACDVWRVQTEPTQPGVPAPGSIVLGSIGVGLV